MKKLSIIVPCYNVEKYVARTLESLLKQNCDLFTVLAIDDGSTDSTLEILQSYERKYPDTIQVYTKKNGGIAQTRNFGLSLVSTEYFGFLDSDDYIYDGMLEKMLHKAETTQAELVVCNFEWVFETGNKENYITKEGPYQPGKQMMLNLFAVLWNKIYRTNFVRKTSLKFPDGYRYEDASFLYRLVPHVSHVEFVEEPFVAYVQREGSITHTHNEKVKDMVHVFDDLYQYYKENHYLELYKDELEYIFVRFFLGNSFLRSVQIKDKNDRLLTLELSWKTLDDHFPEWKKNKYVKMKGLKNLYYRLINRNNYMLFGKVFALIRK